MRLAKSQAHQPFPGFLGPGFFLSNHRCKSLFQSVCPDSNRAFSLFRQMHSASALFERRFSRLAAVFFSKISQRIGRRFVGPDGLRKRRPFFISERSSLMPYYFMRDTPLQALEQLMFSGLFAAVEQTFKPEANVNMVLHQVFDTMLSFAARVLGGEMPDDDAATQWAFEQIYSFVVPNVREELLISSGSTPA